MKTTIYLILTLLFCFGIVEACVFSNDSSIREVADNDTVINQAAKINSKGSVNSYIEVSDDSIDIALLNLVFDFTPSVKTNVLKQMEILLELVLLPLKRLRGTPEKGDNQCPAGDAPLHPGILRGRRYCKGRG